MVGYALLIIAVYAS